MYRSCYNIKLASKLYFHWLFPAIVPNSPQQPSIRQLIESALTDDQLKALCFDRFREIYDRFTEGQTRGDRIILLANYVEKQRKENILHKEIERLNPNVYREYQQKLREYDRERQYQDLVKNPPKVLIGYAHPPRSNDRRQIFKKVAYIADRLRVDGINCHIDQFEANPPDDRWMGIQLAWADYVLVVCTEQF